MAVLSFSCSSFIPDDEFERLRLYEAENETFNDYILLQDITVNEVTLTKGTRVRIVLATGDDWVKVYAYRAEEDLLKSSRTLVLLMFDDEFTDKKFSREKFDQELAKFITKADMIRMDDVIKQEKKQSKKKKNK